VSVTLRNFVGLAAAFGVAWFGGLILGEYPFDGALPVFGGFLMGVSVVGAAAFVEEGEDPPPWVVVACAVLAVWGIWRAAWFDAGAQGELFGLVPQNGIGPLPGVATYAMVGAAVGALIRLIPRRRRDPALEEEEEYGDDFDEEDEQDEQDAYEAEYEEYEEEADEDDELR